MKSILPPILLCLAIAGLYEAFRFRDLPVDGLGLLLIFEDRAYVDIGHFLYTILNRALLDAFGIEDKIEMASFCHRLNILFSILALFVTYHVVLRLFKDKTIAALGTVLMAVAPAYWWYSETIEVHTLHALSVALTFWALVRLYELQIDFGKTPWRQSWRIVGNLVLLFIGSVFVLGSHVLGMVWFLAAFLAFVLTPSSPDEDKRRRTFGPFVNGIAFAVLILIGIVGTVLFVNWDHVVLYYKNRTPFIGKDYRSLGFGENVRNVFDQLFSQSFMLSLFAIPGLILLWHERISLSIKMIATMGLLTHMFFMAFYVSNHGGFFIPIYLLNLSLSLYYLDRLCRFTSFNPLRALNFLLAITLFLVYLRSFYFKSDLLLLACFLGAAVGCGISLGYERMEAPRRVGLISALLIVLIGFQVYKSFPTIKKDSANESLKNQAIGIGELAGPDSVILATHLAPYILFYTGIQVLQVTDQLGLETLEEGITRDDLMYDRLEISLGEGRRVLMTKPTRAYLRKNDILFPKTFDLIQNQVQLQDLGEVFLLRPASSR
jgi:hypothetical protein